MIQSSRVVQHMQDSARYSARYIGTKLRGMLVRVLFGRNLRGTWTTRELEPARQDGF